MDTGGYSPRFIFIILIALVVGQVLTFNYLKNDFDRQIKECYDAINTNTILQGALVNILVKKNIIQRDQLLNEAGSLSTDLMKKMQELNKEPRNQSEKGVEKMPEERER